MDAMYFDMDGTLIDSRADLAATVNHTRRDLGLAELPQDRILCHVGRGARHLLANAIPEPPARQDGQIDLFKIFMSHYGEHMLEAVALYPGVEDTLAELRDRGWLLGINTAKPRFATLAILEHFGLMRFFGDAIVAGGDCAEMKPSPLPLRLCAEKLHHVPTPRDWMVGDNWTDVQCGANAGVKSAFCSFGFGILADSVPTVTLARFPDLKDLIAGDC